MNFDMRERERDLEACRKAVAAALKPLTFHPLFFFGSKRGVGYELNSARFVGD